MHLLRYYRKSTTAKDVREAATVLVDVLVSFQTCLPPSAQVNNDQAGYLRESSEAANVPIVKSGG